MAELYNTADLTMGVSDGGGDRFWERARRHEF